jgi:hypothetical protein
VVGGEQGAEQGWGDAGLFYGASLARIAISEGQQWQRRVTEVYLPLEMVNQWVAGVRGGVVERLGKWLRIALFFGNFVLIPA